MHYSSSVSSKGQVTIPQEVRLRLGLQEGDRVEFVVEGDRTLLRPARLPHNPFERYVGALGSFPGGAEEINAWVAALRDEAPDLAEPS
jgi:antitoxin PrlF